MTDQPLCRCWDHGEENCPRHKPSLPSEPLVDKDHRIAELEDLRRFWEDHASTAQARCDEARAERDVARAELDSLRETLAIEIHSAKPKHLTRNYTPVDQAYDTCAAIVRGTNDE